MFRQTTLDWEWWRLCCSFVNLTEWRERRVTCQQLISNTREKISHFFFLRVLLSFPQDWKSLYNTVVCMIKHFPVCICVRFSHVWIGKRLNHCRPSWKNTSTALAYLSFLAFSLNVWTRLHFHLRLRLHLHHTCEPVFRSLDRMTYL